ncbi:MAG: acetylglutamate kinase [Pseudomonadota bacterium]
MTDKTAEAWLEKAHILSEALPYMQRYEDKVVVVKYGGHAMGDDKLAAQFARDIVLLKQVGINVIIVHGGGPQIGSMLKRLAIESEFQEGLRVTDEATVEVVEMVLSGKINGEVVTAINQSGGKAVGLSGKDGSLIVAKKMQKTVQDSDSNIERVLDLGFVGEPEEINPDVLKVLIGSDLIPVIAPIGVSKDGHTYNINADTAAGAIAGALDAKRLLMLTDVRGVLNKDGDLLTNITPDDAKGLIADGTISGGMIPKIETCLEARAAGTEAAVILDGRVPHAVLLELFTEHGAGSLIG